MGQISAVAGISAYSTQNLSLSHTHTHKGVLRSLIHSHLLNNVFGKDDVI